MIVKKNWHKDFFKNAFYNPASPAALAKAPEEVRFVIKALKLKKGSKVLDMCCGPGRHSVLLAKKGLDVTGFDFSKEYLAEAAERAKKNKVQIRLVRGDMRKLPYSNEFDAVINMFTSFGYFSEKQNIAILKKVAGALKPHGKFFIDIVHKENLDNNLHPKSWNLAEDGSYHLQETEHDKRTGLAKNRWIVVSPGFKVRERRFTSYSYDRKTMAAILKKAGLKPLKFWGGFDGDRLREDS